MTKAIIFDLDSCLAAADEVGEQLFALAFAAIRAANDGSVPEEKLRAAFAECWRVAFDAVADKYGFTEAMRAAGWQVFRQTEVTGPMYGYGDLAVLKDLPVQRFLGTSGFRRLQESKVRALGFADWFAAIYIDALDEPNRRGKHGFFQDILSTHGLRPDEVLVVGDNPDSEIEAGAAHDDIFPNPSLSKLATQLGCNQSTLQRRFPELSEKIKQRYQQYGAIRIEVRSKLFRSIVNSTIMDIHKEGIYPSQSRVREALPKFVDMREPVAQQEWKQTLAKLNYTAA